MTDPDAVIKVTGLGKTYASGFQALHGIDLEIRRGEIFALLGPNGAGKTTLISTICGLVTPTTGSVTADGHDIALDYRAARAAIGLVPQELSTNAFESVWDTVTFSRGLFGKPTDRAAIERVLGTEAGYVVSPGTYDQKHIDRIGRLKNCIAYGPGVLDLAHQPDEWIGVGDMLDSARVMALVLEDLLGSEADSGGTAA